MTDSVPVFLWAFLRILKKKGERIRSKGQQVDENELSKGAESEREEFKTTSDGGLKV